MWDLATGRTVAFEPTRAQTVFRIYVRLALEHGIIDSNWPVLEQASLLHDALALDDPAERARILHLALEVELPHQDSLRKMLAGFDRAGCVWPESLQYSAGVLNRLIYSLALLQRLAPMQPVAADFGTLAASLLRLERLTFPNGAHVRFGDGPRRFKVAASSLEIGYAAARRQEGQAASVVARGEELQRRIATGGYERGRSEGHRTGADSYRDPLAVLWYAPRIAETPATVPLLPTTDALPFAGLVLQRNLAPGGDPRDGLLALVSGGHHVRAHASGMALELYGAGQVQGTNAGKGRYTTEGHENYRRLFAANNTVIVNGATRSGGGWVNLWINQVEPVALEPALGADPVLPNHSFPLTRWVDDRSEAAAARQERLVGLVRTGPQAGFYVDVFRSRAELPGGFHDYVYHNIGDRVLLTGRHGALSTTPQPDLFPLVPGAVWQRNRSYLWPGWHAFTDVAVGAPMTAGVTASFESSVRSGAGWGMRAHFAPAPVARVFATARTPATKSAPTPHEQRSTPTVIVRQSGGRPGKRPLRWFTNR